VSLFVVLRHGPALEGLLGIPLVPLAHGPALEGLAGVSDLRSLSIFWPSRPVPMSDQAPAASGHRTFAEQDLDGAITSMQTRRPGPQQGLTRWVDRGWDTSAIAVTTARRSAEMANVLDRETMTLVDSYLAGQMSRRSFIRGLLALGLSAGVAGAVLATASRAQGQTGSDVQGTMRFMIGPWTDKEVDHQEVVQAGFNELWPNVTFSFKLFNWPTASAEVDASLAEGAHDIYYFGEGGYPNRAAQQDGFEDLTARINDPAWAEEKAKYLYWDRIGKYGDKLIGLPVCFHVEDALFVNMDKVRTAGFDETFVDSWATFVECVGKMTNGSETYGAGVGMQLGAFAEWYQRLRAAGGSYLTEDLSAVNVNHPEVVQVTQDMADLFTKGYAPPLGTYDYDTAPDAFIAGKLATYSSDLTIAAVLMGKPQPPTFEWAILPYPPGPVTRVNFNDIGFYAMGSRTPDKDLAWEVLKWWTNSDSGSYWADVSGTYPGRTDALEHGYGANGAPQLAAALPSFQQFSVGPEPFAEWGTIEDQAEAQAQQVYLGAISAADGVAKIADIVQQEVFG
jgi:multiple sugar transport system substrate-binding protein